MQPRLTQVPPSAASSATATRAPRCAAMRAARTPPLPAPMMNRSKAASLIRSRRRSLERLPEQLGDESVDAVLAAGALLAQRAGEIGRQLACERHQAGGRVDAPLLAPIDDVARALAEAARCAGDLHLAADLLAEQLVEVGLLHAHGVAFAPCTAVIVACCGTVGRWPRKRPSARPPFSWPTSIAPSTATTSSPWRDIRRRPTSG